MSYVKTINEDGVVSDIMAKALDPELDAAVLKRTNLVNGFTQTEAGVNALDAAAGKSLNDSLATKASSSDLSDFETAVAANYAPQTDSLTFPSWLAIFPCRTDGTNIDVTIPCSSLKNGTLSVSGNTTWNIFVGTGETGNPNKYITGFTIAVSSITRVTRDILILRGEKPSEITSNSGFGVAVNRGQFTISST